MVNDIEVYIAGLNNLPEPVSPSGSTKTVACVQRSVLEQGMPEPSPCCLWAGAVNDQPNEDVAGRVRESDPPIVVGDGNPDHMAKGRAEEQSQHRTDAAARRPHKSVSSSLLALGQKAEEDPAYRFFDLYGMINEPMLIDCFYDLRRPAAPGVDGMTVSEYEKELGPRVAGLVERLKEKRYRAQLVKRQYIDKGGGKLRPLGLPTLEDKLVQMAARRVLEAIYEKDFLDCNNGYRPGRSARETTQKLQDRLFRGRIRWMVEADIEGFFEHIDHDWLIQMIEQRVNDSAFVLLIRKWLKAGVMEETGTVLHPASGTPQGGVISPVLANIYLHYVLDLWTEKVIAKSVHGQMVYERYADDFVCGFEHKEDADNYLAVLRERLAKFGLKLSEAKSGIVKFNRHELRTSQSFTFLGFEFYWKKTRRGFPTVTRRTSKKKFTSSLHNFKEWLKKNRSRPLGWLGQKLSAKLRGYWNYYGVIGNSMSLKRYWKEVQKITWQWLNRRSQRKSYRSQGFAMMWENWGLPRPRIVESPYRPQPLLPL
jgi:RNA-directed DNA polymerase